MPRLLPPRDLDVRALRRLLALLPVMLVVVTIVFLLIHLSPGDPAAVIENSVFLRINRNAKRTSCSSQSSSGRNTGRSPRVPKSFAVATSPRPK